MTFNYITYALRQNEEVIPANEPDIHVPETSGTYGYLIWISDNLVVKYQGLLDDSYTYRIDIQEERDINSFIVKMSEHHDFAGKVFKCWIDNINNILLGEDDEERWGIS